MPARAYEAPRTKRNRNRQINERWPTNAGAPLRDNAPDHQQTKTEKQKIPTTTPQAAIRKRKKKQTLKIATEEKAFQLRSEQITTTIETKLKQQFGFVADPKKTLLHNASSALANTPTWYYFSRPSHLAFHDFTQQKQPPKNLRSLLGLGLKFILTPHLTNIWKKLEKTTMPNFQRAIHLRFHFAGSTNTSNEPYDPKMYVRSNWTPPHWTKPPVVLDKHHENFSSKLDKLFKI